MTEARALPTFAMKSLGYSASLRVQLTTMFTKLSSHVLVHRAQMDVETRPTSRRMEADEFDDLFRVVWPNDVEKNFMDDDFRNWIEQGFHIEQVGETSHQYATRCSRSGHKIWRWYLSEQEWPVWLAGCCQCASDQAARIRQQCATLSMNELILWNAVLVLNGMLLH